MIQVERRRSRIARGVCSDLVIGGMVIALLPLASLRAQEPASEPIVTDRPDFVESSLTVGAGRFQFELGAQGDWQGAGTTRDRQYASPLLLRYGVAPTLELRMETDGYLSSRLGSGALATTTTGFSDAALGLKWHMADGQEGTLSPSVAWLLHADLPCGSHVFRGHGVRPSLRAVGEWEVPGAFSLGVMPGLVYDSDDLGNRFVSGILAATMGHDWTDRFHTFVEVSGQALQAARYGGNVVTFDTGAGWLFGPDLQLDTAVSFGMTSAAPDLTVALGISRLFR